jgi:hypothetical protein
MAKIARHSFLSRLSGRIGDVVVRQTRAGPVMSRRPDMSKVKWSPAQRARRKLMRAAGAHYRVVMSDPKEAARYRALAAKKKIPVSAFVMGEFLKRGGK